MTKNEFFQKAVLAIAKTHPIDMTGAVDSVGEIFEKARMLTVEAEQHSKFDEL